MGSALLCNVMGNTHPPLFHSRDEARNQHPSGYQGNTDAHQKNHRYGSKKNLVFVAQSV